MTPATVAFGGTVGAAVRLRWFSLGLEGTVTIPTSTPEASGHIVAWLAAASLLPCASLGPAFACLEGQLGSLQTSGDSAPGTRSRSLVWGALGGRIGVLFPLTGRLSVRGRADLLVDLAPPILTLDGNTAWNAPGLAGSFGLDLVVRF